MPDLEQLEVVQDDVLELLLLLGRVGVVKAQDELALEVVAVVLVQHGGLGVPDVQVAAGLGGEPDHHLAHLGAGQVNELPTLVLGLSGGALLPTLAPFLVLLLLLRLGGGGRPLPAVPSAAAATATVGLLLLLSLLLLHHPDPGVRRQPVHRRPHLRPGSHGGEPLGHRLPLLLPLLPRLAGLQRSEDGVVRRRHSPAH